MTNHFSKYDAIYRTNLVLKIDLVGFTPDNPKNGVRNESANLSKDTTEEIVGQVSPYCHNYFLIKIHFLDSLVSKFFYD